MLDIFDLIPQKRQVMAVYLVMCHLILQPFQNTTFKANQESW